MKETIHIQRLNQQRGARIQQRAARDQSIVKEYEVGATRAQVARWHAVDVRTVDKVLREYGVVRRQPKAVGIDAAEIGARAKAGETIQALRWAYGLSDRAIRKVLRAQGIVLRTGPKPGKPKPLAARDRAIVGQHEAGVAMSDLEEMYGLSRSQLYRILSDHGVEAPNAARDSAMAEQYRAGASITELCQTHGIGLSAVYVVLKAQGVTLRPMTGRRGPRKAARDAEIVARARAGESVRELGWAFDIQPHQIYKILRQQSIG